MARTAGSTNIPWRELVMQLRQQPGKWRLFSEMVSTPLRTITVIRNRERTALRITDGTIRARRVNTAWLDDGRVVCDIWLKYEPREEAP